MVCLGAVSFFFEEIRYRSDSFLFNIEIQGGGLVIHVLLNQLIRGAHRISGMGELMPKLGYMHQRFSESQQYFTGEYLPNLVCPGLDLFHMN